MPPPPPPPAPPPPTVADAPPANSALLKSIQKGAKLKKAVTNDRSAPIVDAPKSAPGPMGAGPPTLRPSGANRSPPLPRAAQQDSGGPAQQLGGLFAGGMPKLKSTGNRLPSQASVSNGPSFASAAAPPPPSRTQPPPPAPRQSGAPSATPPMPPRAAPVPPVPASRPAPPLPPARTSPPAQRTSPQQPPRFGASSAAPPVIPARQAPPPPPSRTSVTLPVSMQRSSVATEADNASRGPVSAFGNTLKPTNSDHGRIISESVSARSNASATESDGRWTFRTDLPPPRQFPSGEPANFTPSTSSPIPRTGRAPPPPPPSRSSVTKRPPPPPPPR